MRAVHTARPWSTSRWQKPLPPQADDLPQLPLDLGRLLDVVHQPMRLHSRMQWVSVTMAGLPNTSPMIRFALLRPTPGRASSALKSSVHGSRTCRAASAYRLKYPVPCCGPAAGLNDGLNIRRIRCSQFFYAGVLGKQLLHHHVYAGHRCTGPPAVLTQATATHGHNPACSRNRDILPSGAQYKSQPALVWSQHFLRFNPFLLILPRRAVIIKYRSMMFWYTISNLS